MDLRELIDCVAWGGCARGFLKYKYSFVCHTHSDHIVTDKSITIVGPVAKLKRDVKYKIVVAPGRTEKLHLLNESTNKIDFVLTVWVLGSRFLRGIGLSRDWFHAWDWGRVYPMVIVLENVGRVKKRGRRGNRRGDRKKALLYIDDFDVDDVEDIKKLIMYLRGLSIIDLRMFLMPVYNGAISHGAKDPKELVDACKDLMLFAMSEGLEVGALAHPVIPSWVPPEVIEIPKTLLTEDKLKEKKEEEEKEGQKGMSK